MKIKKIVDYLLHPKKVFKYVEFKLLHSAYGKKMDDEKYIKKFFKSQMGYELNLDNPRTFNEKLQWLKLNDRNPEYTVMVDKYLSKKYVADRIGEEYVVPLYGVWDGFDEIDFDKLPEQFVLKTTHDCGGVVVCKDKSSFDREKAKKFLEKHLKREYFYHCREWPYKNVKPRIIAEKFLDDDSGDAICDYKFFCFGGVPKIMYVSRDKSGDPRTDFFDMDFQHLDLRMRDPHADVLPEMPEPFVEMKKLAVQLSKGIPHIRVDFYVVGGKVYVGELTFFHCGGFMTVSPAEWSLKMGEWIALPVCEKD